MKQRGSIISSAGCNRYRETDRRRRYFGLGDDAVGSPQQPGLLIEMFKPDRGCIDVFVVILPAEELDLLAVRKKEGLRNVGPMWWSV
jgi:hypothetical protein